MGKLFLIDELTSFDEEACAALLLNIHPSKREGILQKKHCVQRRNSIVGYTLLLYILRVYYGVARSDDVMFTTRGNTGKPVFADSSLPNFSISHTDELVGAVLSTAPVGIDIESVQADMFGVQRFFASAEQALLAARDNNAPLFTTMWTMKEAYGKRSGRGIDEQTLGQHIFEPRQSYLYEEGRMSVVEYKDHIISVYGKSSYNEQSIEVVSAEALLHSIA